MASPTTRDGIASLFRSGAPDELKAFILSCPEFPFRDQAAQLATMDVPAARSLALGMVGQGLAFGRATGLGAEVALAAHTLLREDFARHGPQAVLPLTLSRAASEALSALNLAGRYDDALAFADEVIPLYDDEPENGPTIRVAKITALYQLSRIDEAKAAIERERRRGVTGPAVIELDRLQAHIERMTGRATELKAQPPATEVSEALAEENRSQRDLMDRMTSLLAGAGEEMNEWRAMQMIRDGTAIFTHPTRGRDPAALRESLAQLTTARDWARTNESSAHENDALWGIYLCRSRLGAPAGAAAALEALRANLEKARASVANPIERGGTTTAYPHLFPALCKMLMQTNRPLALLEAMEGAKGRAVADLLVKRSGAPLDERALAAPAALLPSLMRQVGAHYLSYLVDDGETYAVLVAKDGSVHQADTIPLGRETIRAAALKVDPRKWGGEAVDLLLAPLVSWLGPLLTSGLLADGDHICYSADEHLHHIPLHFLRFNGEPLAATFSVSRTHGAAALSILLSRPLAERPAEFVVVEVPTRQNAEEPRFLEGLARARTWLQRHAKGKTVRNDAARPDALARLDLTHRLVHFATHGRFPEPGGAIPPNPYTASGLLLAGPDGLPDVEQVKRGELEDAILTPQRILDMGLDFTGSHVTLQACVSGLAEQGLGGDALGLDWALMQAGASSLLATHWNIRLGLSAVYFEHFYKHWLQDGLSRAAAWWSTIRELRREGGALADPYSWAAFSLSGDWR